MKKDLVTTIKRWLNAAGIKVSSRLLSKELRSHPKFPSLISITDVLDELNINNGAYVVDKSKVDELDLPFLAHIDVDEGEFILVDPRNKTNLAESSVLKHWDGIAVFAEKSTGWGHNENEELLRKENQAKWRWSITLTATVVLMILAMAGPISVLSVSFFALSLLGFITAVLIVQKEMGISNRLSNKLCSISSNTGCEGVLQSKASQIGGLFKWSDLGITYFAILLLLQAVNSPLIPFISFAALPFTAFSLYYQGVVEKKWCTLCLVTVSILWMQCLLSVSSLSGFSFSVLSRENIVLILALMLTVTMVWLGLLRPVVQQNNRLVKANFDLTRFKYDNNIFTAALRSQRKIDTAPMEGDLQLGNKEASIQLLVACNTFCNPCARAHKALHELLTKNNIGLTVRFALGSDDLQYKSANEVNYILHILEGATPAYRQQVLHDWFELMDLDEFTNKYPHVKSAAQLAKHPGVTRNHEWARSAGISFTPTLFVNGFELPENYKVGDLRNIIRATIVEDAGIAVSTWVS
jgi:hypothetical protein